MVLAPGKELGIDAEYVATWVETESSFKADLELEKLLGHAWRLGQFIDARERVLLEDMAIVFDGRANHESRLIRAAKRLQARDMRRREEAGERGVADDVYQAVWEAIRLVAVDISPPLHIRGWYEKSLLSCLSDR